MKEYKIYVLLQEYKGVFGELCKWMKGEKYNHASIGITDEMSEFYSFRTKWGLCVEHPFRFNKEYKKDVPCLVYELIVTQKEYERVEEEIHRFLVQKENYYYSYLSVILGFLGIRHSFSNGYFCSKFVAEILNRSGVLSLNKHASIYMPYDFSNEKMRLQFEGVANEFCIYK